MMHISINVKQQSAYTSYQNAPVWPYSSAEMMGSPTEKTAVCFRVILINPHFVTCDNTEKEMWVYLKVFPDRILLLLVTQQTRHELCIIYSHSVKIIWYNPNQILT
jgi:hypothetical protein